MPENKSFAKIKTSGSKIKSEVRIKVTTYILSALGLVAGLAWNDAIKSLIEYAFPSTTNSILAKIIYAAGLTLIVVLVTIFITKIFEEKKQAEEKINSQKAK